MKKILFALALLVSSCGLLTNRYPIIDADLLKDHSIQRFAQQDLDALLMFLGDHYEQEGFGRLGPEWKVTFLDRYIRAGTGFADGLTIPREKTIFIYLWKECLADSSIAHEYGHALSLNMSTSNVRAHPEVLRDYQKGAYQAAIRELCLPGYNEHSNKVFMEAIEK